MSNVGKLFVKTLDKYRKWEKLLFRISKYYMLFVMAKTTY
jgi:hypothetical protein